MLMRSFRIHNKLCLKMQPRLLLTSYSTGAVNILGIETSCDDTCCAIVNDKKEIISESIKSQQLVHLRNGGIIPPIAQSLHREFIKPVVDEAIQKSNLNFNDINAIAVTVKPGLPLSLAVGMKYAKLLANEYKKPLIPIHHMEAHALTARLEHHDIEYPFLALLISGGHCLLSLVNNFDDFKLLGESFDEAPGEAFDKMARRMKLRNIVEYSALSGGQAIELASKKATNLETFQFPISLAGYRDCSFSFTGLKNSLLKRLFEKEKEHGIIGDGVIPEVYDLCASFQMAVARHICHRTNRAIEFLQKYNHLPEDKKQLIVSGGVACNNFIFTSLKKLCEEYGYRIYRPKPQLCTDNGVMIAWNGVERWINNKGIVSYNDLESVDLVAKCKLGEDWTEKVKLANIPIKTIGIKALKEIY